MTKVENVAGDMIVKNWLKPIRILKMWKTKTFHLIPIQNTERERVTNCET